MRIELPTSAAILWCLVVHAQDAPPSVDNLVKYTLSAEGINASFIGYGARLTNLFVKDKNDVFQDVVMGYDEGTGYLNDTNNEHTYFGAASTLPRSSNLDVERLC